MYTHKKKIDLIHETRMNLNDAMNWHKKDAHWKREKKEKRNWK